MKSSKAQVGWSNVREKVRLWAAVAIVVLLALVVTPVAGALELPKPVGYVNDFADMLSPETVDDLEGKLRSYERESGNEIAVATVEDLQGTTIEDYAVRLFEAWKVGKEGKDNGVLLLVAEKEREMRIEVGYGLEPELTDAESYAIIQNVITPAFKAGDFDRGVTEGVDAMITTISGGEVPEAGPASPDGAPSPNPTWFIYMGAFLLFGGLQWLGAVLARTRSWWLGGLLGFLIGLAVALFSIVLGVIAIAVLTPLGLLFDFVISRTYEEYKKQQQSQPRNRKGGFNDRHSHGIPWWAGGGWGPGGSRGGGGFGGFGGGRSGGGGASGGW